MVSKEMGEFNFEKTVMVFLVVGPLRFITQLPGEFSPFIEEKVFFCLVIEGGGVSLPHPLSGPTTKK